MIRIIYELLTDHAYYVEPNEFSVIKIIILWKKETTNTVLSHFFFENSGKLKMNFWYITLSLKKGKWKKKKDGIN